MIDPINVKAIERKNQSQTWKKESISKVFWPSRLGLHNTPTTLQRGKIPYNECPDYDTKQSDD